ncbi:hypothetical protein [Pseudogemmobacter sonorensis]|uniref:hypothetical protein n=1 Tax=Pseudogemmobacter sonorensis TaxID=2989681 RepID=UPI0036C78ED1
MAVRLNKTVPILLEKDCEFQIGVRKGKVLELRAEGYFAFWEPWTDEQTGEYHESTAGVISFSAVLTENNHGKLVVLHRPLAKPCQRDRIRRSERVAVEIARAQFRKQYVLAIQGMLDAGDLKLVREDFEARVVKILARGKARYEEFLAAKAIRAPKRAGARIRKTTVERNSEFEFSQGVRNGRTFWKWYEQWRAYGEDGLLDDYRKCGGHSRYSDQVEAYVGAIIDKLLDEERPTLKAYHESVSSIISAENERRERLPIPEEKLPLVGYDYVRKLVMERAPIDHAIRKKGWDNAYKDLHSLGLGVETSRALERVEVDEYTVDLMVLMRDTGLFDHLPPSVKAFIGLDGKPCRVTLSAAIDVHTRCLLALQIVPQAHTSPLRDTIEMIYMNKVPISDAARCRFAWEQGGAPEMIVLDRGSKYITDEAYAVLASLGITNMGAPAGKPWLKPFIERVFRIIHEDLLLRFSGRTFGSVEKKGDNDPEQRATLTLEAFLTWLVRWTVDAYHNKHHSALGMSPNQAWKKAISECRPRSLTSAEMREAFGVRTGRRIGVHGVRVKHIDYQNDAAIALKNLPGVKDVEVLRWHGDIGTIGLRAGDGPWINVTATDPRWIGKTDVDLDIWLAHRQIEDAEEARARRDFVIDANTEAYRLKKLAGLISLPRTEEELERDVVRFSRHTDTAERRRSFGEYRDILADVDAADEALALSQPNPAQPKTAPTVSDDDLME